MSDTLDHDTPANEVREADAETILRTMALALKEGRMSVVLSNTPMGVKAGVETNVGKPSRFNMLEQRMAEEFIDRYEPLLVDLYELVDDGDEDAASTLWRAGMAILDDHDGVEEAVDCEMLADATSFIDHSAQWFRYAVCLAEVVDDPEVLADATEWHQTERAVSICMKEQDQEAIADVIR